jgi:ABC-type lipoprotein release transport system permease subunit
MALGASSGSVARLVVVQTARPVAVGLLAGAGFAAALATVVIALPDAGRMTDIVQVSDPIAYGTSLLVIVTACLLAAWIPSSRAARLDPMRTLRQD